MEIKRLGTDLKQSKMIPFTHRDALQRDSCESLRLSEPVERACVGFSPPHKLDKRRICEIAAIRTCQLLLGLLSRDVFVFIDSPTTATSTPLSYLCLLLFWPSPQGVTTQPVSASPLPGYSRKKGSSRTSHPLQSPQRGSDSVAEGGGGGGGSFSPTPKDFFLSLTHLSNCPTGIAVWKKKEMWKNCSNMSHICKCFLDDV